MLTQKFYLQGSHLTTVQCPLGSPIPRPRETVRFADGTPQFDVQFMSSNLFDVEGVAYNYPADGSAPEVIVRVDDF